MTPQNKDNMTEPKKKTDQEGDLEEGLEWIDRESGEDVDDLTPEQDVVDVDVVDVDAEIEPDEDESGDDGENDSWDIGPVAGRLDMETVYKLNTNKHKREGKHRLKRDVIFMGRLEKKTDPDNPYEDYTSPEPSFRLDIDSYVETNRGVDELEDPMGLVKEVYSLLGERTGMNFRQNRRKPTREAFNRYFDMLVVELGHRYTMSEIFVELSYYFTDNIFNMFKLLEMNKANAIVRELSRKGYLRGIRDINFQ